MSTEGMAMSKTHSNAHAPALNAIQPTKSHNGSTKAAGIIQP